MEVSFYLLRKRGTLFIHSGMEAEASTRDSKPRSVSTYSILPPTMEDFCYIPCCKTPERHLAAITLSPPAAPHPVKNCKKIINLDKESEIIPSFLLTGSRFDAAMVASSSDTNQHLSRSSKRSRRTIKPTLKRRSAYFDSTASINEEFWELEDIVKSLPPPPLGRPPRRVSISTLKSDTSSSNPLLQSQQEQKNIIAKSA